MSNLDIYDKVRTVPSNALKEIQAGRLKGKSDINPMWRIKSLTEQFGPCGIGWKYTITRQWLETGGKDEIAAFVNIDLFVKYNGEWSDAIPGTGGSMFVANESKGPYVSDECFKMALTDAISVSCKALGFAADVYWDKDSTKYNNQRSQASGAPPAAQQRPPQQPPADYSNVSDKDMATDAQRRAIFAICKTVNLSDEELKAKFGITTTRELSRRRAKEIIDALKEMETSMVAG